MEDGALGKTEAIDPSFANETSYIQSGSLKATSSFNINIDFRDVFYLRGKRVHSFVKTHSNSVQCLVLQYADPQVRTVVLAVVLAVVPDSFNDFSANTKEYVYRLDVVKKSDNAAHCNKPDLLQVLNSLGAKNQIFSFADLCSNCQGVTYANKEIGLYSSTGVLQSAVTLGNLSINILTSGFDATSSAGPGCTSSTECGSMGSDYCCSGNQCVKNHRPRKEILPGYPEYPSYVSALIDVQNNVANYSKYEHFFYLCSDNSGTSSGDGSGGSTSTPEEEAFKNLVRKKELFECANPQDAEMGICTVIQQNASLSAGPFITPLDDLSFSTTYMGSVSLPSHSLYEVSYGEKILFQNGGIVNGGIALAGPGNDDLATGLQINLLAAKRPDAPNDELKIRYKVDASCVKVNDTLAKCQKSYIQAQNLGKTSDHENIGRPYLVPAYADLNFNLVVKLDDIIKTEGTHWSIDKSGSPAEISFIGSTQVLPTQKVEITYFVNYSLPANNVLRSVLTAREEIGKVCACPTLNCTLRPEYGANAEVTDYNCFYPDDNSGTSGHFQVMAELNSKQVPHRYYDQNGLAHDKITFVEISNNPSLKQEGEVFAYQSNDLLRPNNISSVIGMNEIYGQFSLTSNAAQQALTLAVPRGKSIDILVESGSYTSCASCGVDPYSFLNLFPNIYGKLGGGLAPDPYSSNHFTPENMRADDLLFGRACHIPATMIPWTHVPASNTNAQRRGRLAAQHFLFANGYQRDWYGFDYGSVIGSFDGVTWFSVGSKRRVLSTTNKLFLAINAPFGDLATSTTFQLRVMDSSINAMATDIPTSDFASDGAECQRFHVCSVDSDCVSALGWDYACEDVSSIKSQWPRFDANGLELPQEERLSRILGLTGVFEGPTKRCVYRGRGALCHQNYLDDLPVAERYSHTSKARHLGCNGQYHCQEISGNSVFNHSISRFGKSIKEQNRSSLVPESDLDEVGKGARIIGRPLKYFGDFPAPVEVVGNLSANNAIALCLPGRKTNDSSLTIKDLHSAVPSSIDTGSKVNGIGHTPAGNQDSHYLSSCSLLDSAGKFAHFETDLAELGIGNATIQALAAGQAISTNALLKLESLSGRDLLANFELEQVTKPIHEVNRCLRAPGATCFTNLDCAANKIVAGVANTLDASSHASDLNESEIKFWQEELICSQREPQGKPGFSVNNNRCCREGGKELTIPVTSAAADSVNLNEAPGIGISLNSKNRYSGVARSIYATKELSDHPAMVVAEKDICGANNLNCVSRSGVDKQFNTLDFAATRTCCTGNWIRSFSEKNGGGHEWGPAKMQEDFPVGNLTQINWAPWPCTRGEAGCEISDAVSNFSCSGLGATHPQCLIRSISDNEADIYNRYFSSLELTGIPQVGVQSEDNISLHNLSDENQQAWNVQIHSDRAIKGLLAPNALGEYIDGEGRKLYSASDETNFDDDIKQVFSKDEFVCCQPVGTQMESTEDEQAKKCCSGYVSPETNKCALKNYVNVSVYFNRYVSSEAGDLPNSSFDPTTGTPKDAGVVIALACQKNACASGLYALGLAWGSYPINGLASDPNAITNRFIDGLVGDDNNLNGKGDLFKDGLHWNTNVYCAPRGLSSAGDVLKIFGCP